MSDVEHVALWTTGSRIGITVETRIISSFNTEETRSATLSCDTPTDTTQLLVFIGKLKELVCGL